MYDTPQDRLLPGRGHGAGARRADPSRMQARFVDAASTEHEMPWLEAAGEHVLERCVPVRRFPVRRGRRIAPGWWWAATSGRFVHYGFGAMRTQVMMLDRDPSVVALACRPVELLWRGRRGLVVAHAPHLMARLADGSGVLVDCAGPVGPSRALARRAVHTQGAAEAAGWHYRLVGPPPKAVEANMRWLAGFRHPRCGRGQLERVADAFASARPLAQGVAALGDPIAWWPPVYHALWTGALRAVLDRPLHERTAAVWAGPDGGEQR